MLLTVNNAKLVTCFYSRKLTAWVIFACLCGYVPTILASQAGEMLFVKGVVTAHVAGEKVRFLAKGGELFAGDIVTTAKRSFAVLELSDGTKMTLRPETVFKLEEYAFNAENEEGNALLRLFKGGLRSITGLISKKQLGKYRLQTSLATIGIRGTEFEARLCAQDCLEEAARISKTSNERSSPVAARVVFLRGRSSASAAAGSSRKLSVGSSLFAGDIIETELRAIAVIAFKDQSRITLQQSTRFKIERLEFQPKNPETGSMFLRLLKGGLRAVTGLIGKKNQAGFRIVTPAATIGIRGTGFDLVCQGECTTDQQTNLPFESPWMRPLEWLVRLMVPAVFAQYDTGLFASSWFGEIVLKMAYGDIVITENQTVFIANNGAQPVTLPQMPLFIQNQLGPRPDLPESSAPGMEDPFGNIEQADIAQGLYLTVFEGDVVMENENGETVYLGEGESGFSNGEKSQTGRLSSPPYIIATPSPTLFAQPEFQNIFQLFEDGGETPQTQFECVAR